ncbi:MAG: M81 family metallopeptidase [Proteobacteria bacterium]|nr:M81 family metallopeptidase [Pseudomonadota bacterium]
MRLVVAMMMHETNIFSPVPTEWSRFVERGAYEGEAARRAFQGTNTAFAAFLELADAAGAETVIPIAAQAAPSRPVARRAYEHMTNAIADAVAKGCDGALLDLHGAMVSETTEDGEGTLLERLRQIAPGLPIAVALDLHCNLTQAMVENATAMVGYKTYPHIDMHEAGRHAGRIVLDAMAGKSNPVMAWGQVPLLSQTLRQGTDDEPMRGLQEAARLAERGGVLAATVFGGFPLADIKDAGTSVVVVADGDRAGARRARDRLLDLAWAGREEFIYRHRPLAETVAEAKTLTDGPIVLLDHADNCASGGTQDVMTVIAEVMRQDLADVAVAAVWDPDAVKAMQKAGVGRRVTLTLGGKMDMPAIGETGRPLEVTGTVKALTDGEWTVSGPMATGIRVHMGATAVIDTGKVEIVVVSHHHEPFDTGVFTSVGIDPRKKRYLLLKSRIHWRAGFKPLARHTLTLDGSGVTTSDNGRLAFSKVRRPIYPLDRINDWRR